MNHFRRLSDSVLASPQISLDDVDAAQEEGVTLIICNRPDNEDPDQPSSDSIRCAAAEKGINFLWIPITGGQFNEAQVSQMANALSAAEGKVLAYCRSGTRSTLLWALAEASKGGDPDQLARRASAAGYDLSPVRQSMEMLAAERG